MSHLSDQVLAVVRDHGPLSANEVDRHLMCGVRSASNSLTAMYRKGLVQVVFTGVQQGYQLTARGEEAAAQLFLEDDLEETGDPATL